LARRRYTSTEISTDKKVNKLGLSYGDFAVMLYTWMIPHAEDNCEITGDPEELKFIVCPGRKDKTEDDIKNAIDGMAELKLISLFERDGKPMILFPPKSFYKYQTYISHGNRDFRGVVERSAKKNAEEHRETPQNTVSPSPSPSLSLSPISSGCSNAREGEIFKFFNGNIGMITPYQAETISQYLDDGIEPEMIIAILKDSIGKSDRWGWSKKVIDNSIRQNVRTVEQYNGKKVERENVKNRDSPRQQQTKVPQKGNFDQRKYTDQEFEGLFKEV